MSRIHYPCRVEQSLNVIGALILFGTCLSGLLGCDRVRTTSQTISIFVEDDAGLPVRGMKVRAKESWESWQPEDNDQAGCRRRWEGDFVPWLEGVTDSKGKVVLHHVVTALDGTSGSEPPAERDWVSNREYLVRLQEEGAEDELRIPMKLGTAIRSKRFTLRLDALEKPRYVRTTASMSFSNTGEQ